MKLVEKPKKTKTGQYKTDEQTLSTLAGKHPIVAEILDYREASQAQDHLRRRPARTTSPRKTGRVHTHFHQLVAATGRLASSDPNLQNIPIRTEAGPRDPQGLRPARRRTSPCSPPTTRRSSCASWPPCPATRA